MDYIEDRKCNRDLNDYALLFKQNFYENNSLNYIRAPGRVNIIGEHIDYCGYSVLPMAIEKDITMIFHTVEGGDKIFLKNKDPLYEPCTIDTNNIKINDVHPKWYDYFLCGYRAIVDYAAGNDLVLDKCSLFVVVDGTIPPNSGLSSSSALVVCAALVTMKSFNLNIPAKILAKLCASCEKFIGTQGGGMDQTISLMATSGSAMLIDFSAIEFEVERVYLPEDAVFVVTNSNEQMNKAASNQFNQRVIESKISAKVLLALVEPNTDTSKYNRLVDVQKKLNLDFTEMLDKIEELLKKTYSKEEIMRILSVSEDVLKREILSKNTQEMTEFHLYNRAMHVISEAQRVLQFTRLCSSGTRESDTLSNMGRLMDESQRSCKELYECSSVKLDQLVDICKNAGSYGSRLTGAGWGGCVISLLSKETVHEFLSYVASHFYHSSVNDVEGLMFVTKPSDGASFFH